MTDSAPPVLPGTLQLLEAIHHAPEGALIEGAELGPALDEVVAELRSTDAARAAREYLGVLGVVSSELERPDLAQQLVEGLLERMNATDERHLRAMLSEVSSRKDGIDAPPSSYEKLGGEAPLPDAPSTGSKVSFSVPKGSVKG